MLGIQFPFGVYLRKKPSFIEIGLLKRKSIRVVEESLLRQLGERENNSFFFYSQNRIIRIFSKVHVIVKDRLNAVRCFNRIFHDSDKIFSFSDFS